MSRNVFNSIKAGIDKGIYTTVRLVKMDGSERSVLLPYTKNGGTKEAVLSRMEQIRHQLEKKLDPGEYVIEARMGNTPNSLFDKFPFTVKAPVMLTVQEKKNNTDEVIDKTNEQETMNDISMEDYIDLVRENEKLKADVKFLQLRLELMDNEYKSKPPALAENGVGGTIMKVLEDNLPTAINIFDKYMQQRDRSMDLKEKELNLADSGQVKSSKKKVVNGKERQLIVMQKLYEQDEDSFNKKMDELEQSDPETYDYICVKMDLVNEEGEEEEEQE